ncbi:MAG: helicase-associated domain-containing protein [Planctomycetota bacterium]|nr:helicase-associated domain-containing protein [Planctomycetota bacterium]
MTIIEFLNKQRIESLQKLEMYWTDAYRSSTSKSDLISRIRRAMTSGPVLLGRFQALPAAERRLMEILLKASNDVLDNLQKQEGDASTNGLVELLESLVGRGFIEYRPEEKRGSPVANAFIPSEVADALRELLHDDVRHPEQLLSIRSFLLSHEMEDTSSHLGELGVEIETGEDAPGLADQLCGHGNIRKRLDAIESSELRRMVDLAINEHCGLLPLTVIRSEVEPFTEEIAGQWRNELEDCLLGTIGSLSLNHLGINVRSEYLVIFLEVATELIRGDSVEAPQGLRIASNGFKTLFDYVHILNRVQRESLRMTQTGGFRKHGAEETVKSLLLSDEDGYLDTLVAIARDQELVRRVSDGTLTPTVKAIQWLQEPIENQTRDLLPEFIKDDQGSEAHRHRRLFGKWCRHLKPGEWYPAEQAARLAIIDYILQIASGEQELSSITYQAIHTTPVSLRHLVEDFLKWLQSEPLRIGAVDIAYDGDAPSCIRTTQVTSMLYGTDWQSDPTNEQKVIINPDYEVVLFPGATAPQAHLLVHRLANLFKVDQILHYRIEEDSISTAAALGLTLEEMLEGLTENSISGLPQNIRFSIEGWAGKVYNVTIKQYFILELPSEELVQVVKRLPEIAPFVERQLSPTVLALKEAPTDRNSIRALQELGIYVRR